MKNKVGEFADERLELLFRHAGLSEKQAKLYRLLLTLGEARPAVLSRRSGIKRSTTYALLRDMKMRGLVVEFEKAKVVYFRPEPPERLTMIIEARLKEISIAKELASDLLPTLTTQWKASVGRPVIRYFEGAEGIQKVFEDIYAPKEDVVWGCVDLEKADASFPAYIRDRLIPQRTRNKVVAHSLIADSSQARELTTKDKQQLRKSVLVDKKDYPLPAEIDVYEDKIAMLSFSQGDFVGILIQHPDLAESLRSIFKLAFGQESQTKRQTAPLLSPAPR